MRSQGRCAEPIPPGVRRNTHQLLRGLLDEKIGIREKPRDPRFLLVGKHRAHRLGIAAAVQDGTFQEVPASRSIGVLFRTEKVPQGKDVRPRENGHLRQQRAHRPKLAGQVPGIGAHDTIAPGPKTAVQPETHHPSGQFRGGLRQGPLVEKGLGDLPGVHLRVDEDKTHLPHRNGQNPFPKRAGLLQPEGCASQQKAHHQQHRQTEQASSHRLRHSPSTRFLSPSSRYQ